MPGLYDWYLDSYKDVVLAHGIVYGHPGSRLSDGKSIRTSAVQEMAEEAGGLVLRTYSGSRYFLRQEEIHPICGEDAASHPYMVRDIGAETAFALEQFGIRAGFLEDCLQARRGADARHREEEEPLAGPGELLLTTIGAGVIRSLFRTAEGTPVSVKPLVHVGMLRDSVLITDWEGRTVDFRYFPMERGMEPYHISDGLLTIKVRNLGERAVYFGKTGREVVCPPGEITTIPAVEHDCEGLFSPDAVNGKGLYKKLFSKDGGETDDR